MLRKILDTLGLVTVNDFNAMAQMVDMHATLHGEALQKLSRVEAELAETKTALQLTQRESSAHARTAAEYRKLALDRLDVGASCVGVLGPCGGKFSHYTLQLGVKNGDKYTAIELRTLAASNKNAATLREIANKINEACDVETRIAKEQKIKGSLLRDATSAPELSPQPHYLTTPKVFA